LRERKSSAMEEYLEAIVKLEQKHGVARTYDIAESLHVTPGTVTSAVEQLERHGLVVHVPYKGVKLTEEGRREGVSVVRRHRLAERLLTDILNISWSRSHEIACKFEHVIDDEVARAIERKLNEPATCPHGNPIPSPTGRIEQDESVPLTALAARQKAVIVKITEERESLLRHLSSLGLLPGVEIEVQERAPMKGPILVCVSGASYALGRDVASCIFVRQKL